jgi:hypothetical protein
VPRRGQGREIGIGESVVSKPTTAGGLCLRAAARRNNPEFFHYRDHINEDEAEKKRLPSLIKEVFRSAVVLKFGDASAVEQIRAFLGQPRLLLWPDTGFPISKAESLIRSALGETGLVSGITTGEAVTIRVQTFAYLVEDMKMDEKNLDLLIAQAEQSVGASR